MEISDVRRHPRLAVLVMVALALVGVGLYWFAPWNLVLDRRVDEALPTSARPATGGSSATPRGEAPAGAVAEDGVIGSDEPIVLAEGRFRSLEHETAGSASILRLADGGRVLRLEDLETSNGPDLRVVLTDRPLSEDWHVWDDGELVDLGALKGNLGSSNYRIPAELDLERFRTAVVWCRRFSVGFGVAPIDVA